MIRKLDENDRQSVLEYLYKEASYNIFIIGDIETFGFDKDFQTIYGELNEEGNYQSVLLFYNESVIYYSHQNYFNKQYVSIINNHNFKFISGKEELINLIRPFIQGDFKYQPMYFCHATSLDNEVEITEEIKRVETDEDIEKLYHLLVQIEEFGIKDQTLEEFITSTKKGLQMGMKFVIEKDNKFVSTVATTAETTKNAMVVGVGTSPQNRKNGYASQLMVRLMREYLNNKKKDLCLFYDNPKAGKIYKRLGFKDIGKWVMLKRNIT